MVTLVYPLGQDVAVYDQIATGIARHFAGYARHRPRLLEAWTRGEDVAPDQQPLGDDAWQAQLWRGLVAEIGESPLGGACFRIRMAGVRAIQTT